MKKERNMSVEALRSVFMFGIVLLHVIQFGGHNCPALVEILKVNVVGFMFISGYYGISFSVSKLLRLYGTGLYCAVVSTIIGWGFMQDRIVMPFAYQVAQTFYGYWFIHAYAMTMFFSPMIEEFVKLALAGGEKGKLRLIAVAVPIVFLVFVWSFLPTLPKPIGSFFVAPHGIDCFSGIVFIGVYLSARCWRVFRIDTIIKLRFAIICIVLGLVSISLFRLGNYCSPVAFIVAALIFSVVKRANITSTCRSAYAFSYGGGVAIYLMHTNWAGFGIISKGMVWAHDEFGLCVFVSWFMITVLLFLSLIGMDVIRRIFAIQILMYVDIKRLDIMYIRCCEKILMLLTFTK